VTKKNLDPDDQNGTAEPCTSSRGRDEEPAVLVQRACDIGTAMKTRNMSEELDDLCAATRVGDPIINRAESAIRMPWVARFSLRCVIAPRLGRAHTAADLALVRVGGSAASCGQSWAICASCDSRCCLPWALLPVGLTSERACEDEAAASAVAGLIWCLVVFLR
jgi:hypothetical protein